MAIYLFSQILKFTKYSMKLIEKMSRRHLINSSNVFVIKGFTVYDGETFYLNGLSSTLASKTIMTTCMSALINIYL